VFRRTSVLIFAASLALYGQVNSGRGGASIAIFPPPVAAFEELKQHLGLTDAQVEQLAKLLEERSEARQQVFREMHQKQTELNGLLQSGSRDIGRIGQLTIDIHTLSTQPPAPTGQWRQRALALLTEDQRTRLGPLDQAMKLSTPAHQAVMLDLIDPPPPGRPIILGRPETPVLPAPGRPIALPAPLSSFPE
jgi:hypothetical protein